MNKVLSFVQLDLRIIKPYLKSVALILALGIFMVFMFQSVDFILTYFIMMLIIYTSYPFVIGEKNNLDILYSTLSLDRKTIISGRYIFVLLFALGGIVLSFFSSWIMSAILRQEFESVSMLTISALMFCAFSFVVGFQYPIYFKFGYTKAKMIALIPMFAMFALIVFVPTMANLMGFEITLTDLFSGILGFPAASILGFFFGGLVLLGISGVISYKLYKGKDI